jgi:hypothetical protein
MAPPNPSEPERLEALRERMRATQEAAERIAAEAQAAMGAAAGRRAGPQRTSQDGERSPPPSGYAEPDASSGGEGPDMQALVALVELARRIVPPELSAQLADLLRELLLLARAIIDWYLDRLDRRNVPIEVEDIPIT